MKIIIENHLFDYDFGCKLLKLKYKECPFPELEEDWESIIPSTFEEIAKLENIEERRIGILCLGIERLVKEVKPKLVDKKVLKKKTTWIREDGSLEEKEYDDVYELYTVKSDYLDKDVDNWRKVADCQFVKCTDISTGREYMIWVDNFSVHRTNYKKDYYSSEDLLKKITAIDAIAWTIQTNLPEGNIEKIIRQGDCILLKPKGTYENLSSPRHLSSKEYLKLLTLES